MKRDFISIDGLKNVLSPKELKNITGGSGPGGCQVCDSKCSGKWCGDITWPDGTTITAYECCY